MPYYRKDFSTTEMEILEHEIAAGFLLINLKELRNDHKQEEIINFYVNNYPRLRLPEQDCIILTCWPTSNIYRSIIACLSPSIG